MVEQKSFDSLEFERREAELRDKVKVRGSLIIIELDGGELSIRHQGDHAVISAHFDAIGYSAAILPRDISSVEIWPYCQIQRGGKWLGVLGTLPQVEPMASPGHSVTPAPSIV